MGLSQYWGRIEIMRILVVDDDIVSRTKLEALWLLKKTNSLEMIEQGVSRYMGFHIGPGKLRDNINYTAKPMTKGLI